MGCALVAVALMVPRAVMVFLWVLTNWFGRAFDGLLWPVLGFLFMPYTTLAYVAAIVYNNHSVSGGWLVLVVVAVLVDLGHWGEGGRKAAKSRKRRAGRRRR